MKSKKGQVTLFIIIAIVIVAAAVFTFFYVRRIAPLMPAEIRAVETYFQDCIDVHVKEAARIAAMQGGWIELPDFEPGSAYMPFSNQLNFLGMAVPYWFYVSGNNLAIKQKPSLAQIEEQFSDYIEEHIEECSFDPFIAQGYVIEAEDELSVSVSIKTSSIDTVVNWPLTIGIGDQLTTINEHKVSTTSAFGSLYETAEHIFDAEQQSLFLENYSLDVLRLYAPVTGIELVCAPKTWQVGEVKGQIVEALEGNIGALKAKGDYYKIEQEHKYFEVDVGKRVRENVYFLFNRDMPLRFEVWPSEAGMMKADPIGTQPGLGMLNVIGLCYVPYHFVYDIAFPVLVQISSGNELFQFPMLVVIDKNQARKAAAAETEEVVFDICQFKTQEIAIFTYDEENRPFEADLWYKCFNQACPLGSSKIEEGKARLKTLVPQCYNGFLIARAEGYSEARVQVSSIESFSANIYLKPRHILDLEINLETDEKAIVTFNSEGYGTSVYWPEQKQVELVEGYYNVTASVFKEAEISLQSQTVEKCIKVPGSGLAGLLGAKREECFELDVPAEELTSVLFGGGSTVFYVTDNELAAASRIKLTIDKFDVPADLLELSGLYGMLETTELKIELE